MSIVNYQLLIVPSLSNSRKVPFLLLELRDYFRLLRGTGEPEVAHFIDNHLLTTKLRKLRVSFFRFLRCGFVVTVSVLMRPGQKMLCGRVKPGLSKMLLFRENSGVSFFC